MPRRPDYLDIRMFEKSQQTFQHPSTNTDGFFRLLHVEPLLRGRGDSALHITHFDLLDRSARLPRYAAISHFLDST